MLGRQSHDLDESQNSGYRLLHCTSLFNRDTNFCRSLADKLGNIEQLIGSEAGIDEKWSSLSTNLFDAAAESIGFKTERHEDWFDENTVEISTLLDNKARTASLNHPISQHLRNQWQMLRNEV